MQAMTIVRAYFTESENKLDAVLEYLHDKAKVSGATVFRGISGFGLSGKMHEASLVDLSLDLPLVVEFYDVPEKVNSTISELNTIFEPGHIIAWPVHVN